MSKPQASNHRVSVKVAERQYEFLEDRAKELGLSSKAELLRWYITTDMVKVIEIERAGGKSKEERVFLEGIISDGRVTESDIREVEKESECLKLSKDQRLAQIKGKYSSVLTSSDDFAQQKQKEDRVEK